MIRLFDKAEKDFTTNGIRIMEPLSCVVTEEINGDFSIKLELPPGSEVSEEQIIKVPTPKGEQLFRIYSVETAMDGVSTGYGRHVFYDLLNYFVEDVRPTQCDGRTALQTILSGTGFTGESDIKESGTAYYEMMNPVKAILGADNSFVNVWGGELERDNFSIRIQRRIGKNSNVVIRYRKNLTGLKCVTDFSDIVTRIYPTGRQADGQTLLRLPEKFVDSKRVGNYQNIKAVRVDYPNIKIIDNPQEGVIPVSHDEALELLRKLAKQEFDSGIDLPLFSGMVNFIALENTDEHREYASLERILLGDTLHVIHDALGIALSARVVKYEYDSVGLRYNNLTLDNVLSLSGTEYSTLGKRIKTTQETVNTVDKKVDENKKETDSAIDETNQNIDNVDGKHTEEERVIRQEFRAADGELVSLIEVTAEGLGTEIRQNEAEIELRAKKGELIALINISPESIVIEAKRLDLRGVVKFANLEEEGETTINGGNITTGRIQSEDGTFWVDLNTGECCLQKGTFSGEIDWGGGNVLRQSKYGYTELESSKEITISAPRVLIQNLQISDALRVNGDLSVYNGAITADEVHADNGYSGNVGITRSDGSTRTMRFEDGIFVGYKD